MGFTFSWDAEDRLKSVTDNQTQKRVEYDYDGQGRRVRIRLLEAGVKTAEFLYIWDGLSLCEKRDSAVETFPVAIYYPQGEKKFLAGTYLNYFYLRDRLGSVRGATSDTGSIIQNSDYLPYGPPSPQQPATTDPDFGFTGHLKCPFTGLTLAPFRVLGYANWLSRDPIGEAGGINLYNYVSSNPANLIDPTGEHPVILLSIGIYFATEVYARAPEPGYSGPEGLPFNPLSLTGPLGATGAIAGSRTICPSAAKTVGTELALSPWPANRGFIAATNERKFLMPGETFDRYGFGGGKFVSSTGTPLEMRSLRPGTESLPYRQLPRCKTFRGQLRRYCTCLQSTRPWAHNMSYRFRSIHF